MGVFFGVCQPNQGKFESCIRSPFDFLLKEYAEYKLWVLMSVSRNRVSLALVRVCSCHTRLESSRRTVQCTTKRSTDGVERSSPELQSRRTVRTAALMPWLWETRHRWSMGEALLNVFEDMPLWIPKLLLKTHATCRCGTKSARDGRRQGISGKLQEQVLVETKKILSINSVWAPPTLRQPEEALSVYPCTAVDVVHVSVLIFRLETLPLNDSRRKRIVYERVYSS